jgi:hypothetical protein
MKTLAYFSALALGMLLCGTANAVVILVLNNTGVPSFQQQSSSPCVIGNSSCSNPGGFGFENIADDDGDGTITIAESTENGVSYTVSQVTGIVGSAFNIGVDTNQAGNHNLVSNWVQLQEFDVLINGVIQFQYIAAPPGTPIKLNNGGGYSDATLSLVDLSPFLATDTVTFQTLYNNATNGPESFFLYSTTAPGCTVNCPPEQQIPEPGTLILLGSALTALGGFSRRKARTGLQA